MIIADVLVILISAAASILLGTLWGANTGHLRSPDHVAAVHSFSILGFVLSFFVMARLLGVYDARPVSRGGLQVTHVLQALVGSAVFLCGALYIADRDVSRPLALLFLATTAVLMSASRVITHRKFLGHDAPGTHLRNVLIVGTGHISEAIGDHLSRSRHLGYRIGGYVSLADPASPQVVSPERVLAQVNSLRYVARSNFIDEIVLVEECAKEQLAWLMQEAHDLDLTVRTLSCFHTDFTANEPLEYLGIYPVHALRTRRVQVLRVVLKRIIDVSVALAMLLIVAPLMWLVALAIVLDSPGPVFYVSQRIGKRGRSFPCFKFRSMVTNAEKLKDSLSTRNERDGILFKMKDDPRVTRVGAFIRKYSIDELPQLFNVLRGEMSIVGPRPSIADEVEKYDLDHRRRLEVLPGLTGLWQIEARHDASFAKYVALDTIYVEKWSLSLDIKIMLRTAEVVLRGTGC